jgi:hypothetical protein
VYASAGEDCVDAVATIVHTIEVARASLLLMKCCVVEDPFPTFVGRSDDHPSTQRNVQHCGNRRELSRIQHNLIVLFVHNLCSSIEGDERQKLKQILKQMC